CTSIVATSSVNDLLSLVLAGCARPRQHAAEALANGSQPVLHPADVAVPVGVIHVQCGHLPRLERLEELVLVSGSADRQAAEIRRRARLATDPTQGKGPVAFRVLVNDRPVLRNAQLQLDRL